MTWTMTLGVLLGSQVFLMLIGLPVALAFLAVNIIGALTILGGQPGLDLLIRNSVEAVGNFTLTPIPLFLLMGEVMLHSGLARQAIDAMERLIARVPGRLSLVAITGGTIFATLSGSSIANCAMLGSSVLPEMLRRGYDPRMSLGPILGTGGLAMLIPPSALAVILASLATLSVADVLIASIIPGLLMATLFFVYVLVRCTLNPGLAPRDDVAHLTWGERIMPFLINVVPLLAIFVVVVGSILAGVASPTESAALGCVATVVAAACYRRLTLEVLVRSCRETAKVSVLVLFIIAGSTTFSQILSFSGATDGLLSAIREAGFSPLALILGMLAILLFLGCFMDQFSMMMITVPFFMPLVNLAGIDPIWFAVMMLIMLEVGLLTPPFGMLLFVMKGVAPKNIPMRTVINAAMPFILLEMLTILIVLAVPETALWLPGMLR